MRTRSLTLSLFLVVVACKDDTDKTDDSSSGGLWCDDITEADSYYIEGTGGSATSGLVTGRLITDASGDLHDPSLVGSVEFLLESVDSGGSSVQGDTDDYGEWTRTLGEGTWLFQSSGRRNGYDCDASYEFEVTAGKQTFVCINALCSQ